MRALIIVPLVIAAVIAASHLLTLVTGDMMSAVTLELILMVTAVALLVREPSRVERALMHKTRF
jgi:hypothetical protein